MNAFDELKSQVEEAQAKIFQPILDIINEAEEDASKFYDKENKSAGSRLRSKAQAIRKSIHHPTIRQIMKDVEEKAQGLRSNVNDLKNNS